MSQITRFLRLQFQIIQFHSRKRIHLRPWKEYLAIQFCPRKVYLVIQFRSLEENSLTSTEDRSQMNCASIPDTAESPESSSDRVVGSNNHSLSIADLPLTQEKVESTYADVFQGLGKFPGEPYKLRLKPDAVPVKHRARKSPVHLQDAFHEEVE